MRRARGVHCDSMPYKLLFALRQVHFPGKSHLRLGRSIPLGPGLPERIPPDPRSPPEHLDVVPERFAVLRCISTGGLRTNEPHPGGHNTLTFTLESWTDGGCVWSGTRQGCPRRGR